MGVRIRSGDIRYAGFGFYWAWLFLVFYSPVLAPHSDAVAQLVQDIWTWSAWAHAASLLLGAAFARRLETLARKPLPALASAGLAATGTLLIPLGTSLASTSPALTVSLSTLGAVLSGAATAWIVLSWGEAYGRKGSRFSLFGIIASYLAAVALYFVTLFLPHELALATTVLLPLACGACLASVCLNTPPENSLRTERTRVAATFSPRVALPLLAIFLYALCGEVLRHFATISSEGASVDAMGGWYLAGSAVGLVVIAVLLTALPALRRKNPADMPGMRTTLLIMAAGFLVTTLFNASFLFAYAVFGAAFQCCRVLVWMYSAYITERLDVAPLRVFGVTQGCFALAVVLGTPASQMLASTISLGLTQWTTIAPLAVFLIFMTAIFVVGPKDVESVWGLAEASRAGTARPGSATVDCSDPFDFLKTRYGLSAREYEVALLLARGRSLPFIQEELHIAQGTAQTHLNHIYRKLDVHSRQEFLDVIEQENPSS